MSDVAPPGAPAPGAPPAPPAPAAPAPAAAPPAAPPAAAPPAAPPLAPASESAEPGEGQEPAWLKRRLDRAASKVLRDLGVENTEDAKKALGEYAAKLERDKTELQKALEKAAKVDPLERQLGETKTALAAYRDTELAKLTPERRAAVAAAAGGDDPARQLQVLAALLPTWGSSSAPSGPAGPAAAAGPAAPPPLPAPATTSTAPAAPPPPGPPAPTSNHLATYEQIRVANPLAASEFYFAHQAEIAAAQKARAGA